MIKKFLPFVIRNTYFKIKLIEKTVLIRQRFAKIVELQNIAQRHQKFRAIYWRAA